MHSPYEAGYFIEFWFFLFICKQRGWSWSCLEGELCGFGCRVAGKVGECGVWVQMEEEEEDGLGALTFGASQRNQAQELLPPPPFQEAAPSHGISRVLRRQRLPGMRNTCVLQVPVRTLQSERSSAHTTNQANFNLPHLPYPQPLSPTPPPPAIVTGHSPQGPGQVLGTRLWPKGCAGGETARVQNLGVKCTQAGRKSITFQEEEGQIHYLPWSKAAATLMHHVTAHPRGPVVPPGSSEVSSIHPRRPWLPFPQAFPLQHHLRHCSPFLTQSNCLHPAMREPASPGKPLHQEMCSSFELCQGVYGPGPGLVWTGECGVSREGKQGAGDFLASAVMGVNEGPDGGEGRRGWAGMRNTWVPRV